MTAVLTGAPQFFSTCQNVVKSLGLVLAVWSRTRLAAHWYSRPSPWSWLSFSRRPLPPERFSQFLWGSASSAFSSWRFTTLRTRQSTRARRKSLFRGRDGFFAFCSVQLVLPEYLIHFFFCVMFFCAAEWLTLCLNLPLLAYHVWRWVRNPPAAWPAAAGASLTRTSVAGTRAGPWWAPPDCTTPRPSWTPTSWPSVRKKAGVSWPSTCSPSSTISTGRKPRSPGFWKQNDTMKRVMDLPLLLLQDDLCSGELLKWTPRGNRTCMYSRRPETLILVLQHWTCWRRMISTPHSQHRLSPDPFSHFKPTSAAAFLPLH